MTSLSVSKRERDRRIKQNLDMVEVVADYLISRNDAYEPYREDMIGAGCQALVEWAGRYVGDRFGPSVRHQIRNRMRGHIHREFLDVHTKNGETRFPQHASLDLPLNTKYESANAKANFAKRAKIHYSALPSSYVTEDDILSKIDRERARDSEWHVRERRLPPPATAHHHKIYTLEPVPFLVWTHRKVWNTRIGRVAHWLDMKGWEVRKIEREIERQIGRPE